MKEEFLADGTTSTEGQNKGKITGEKVDNYKTGVVKVMPTTESASKLQSLIAEKKKAAEVAEGAECEKCGGDHDTKDHGKKEDKKEITPGERATYRTLLKNKLRAMGMKNPLIMNMEPGEKETMKAMTSSSAKMAATCESLDKEAAADNETKRLGKEAMRKALDRKLIDKNGGRPISVPPKGSKKGGANNYKLPTRPADGSGTGI